MLYDYEIDGRQRFAYPPFTRIILLTFRHKFKEVAAGAAQHFAVAMKKDFGKFLVGPAEPVVNRIRNQYLMEILLKLPKETAVINACKKVIQEQTAALHNDKKFRSVVVIPDVDVI
jgi:primosomal protein N' (replication factor Y)